MQAIDRMEKRKPGLAARLSAIAIIGLTLMIFWMLRDYGPESTLRRFFQYASRNQAAEMQQLVITQSAEGYNPQEAAMLQDVIQVTHLGTSTIQEVVTEPGEQRALAQVQYDVPGYPPNRETWVLVRYRYKWMVSLPLTFEVRSGLLL